MKNSDWKKPFLRRVKSVSGMQILHKTWLNSKNMSLSLSSNLYTKKHLISILSHTKLKFIKTWIIPTPSIFTQFQFRWNRQQTHSMKTRATTINICLRNIRIRNTTHEKHTIYTVETMNILIYKLSDLMIHIW